MTKILVTGSLGQLGLELQNLAAGGGGECFSWIFTDVGELDITDPESVENIFAQEHPDVVVNCAAWTDVDGAERDSAGAYRINADGPRLLAEASARNGAALIHISTDFVFQGDKSEPYTEDDAPHPLNVYGETKLDGEQAVTVSGCNGAVVRTSWLYSPYGRNFVKSILGAALKGGDLRVVDDQWGNPTAADGLAGAILAMIPQLISAPRPAGIYHYCDSGVTNRYGLAQEIVRQSGHRNRVIPVSCSEYPMTAVRPGYSALDTAKIGRDFGIVPRRWQYTLAGVLARIDKDR